MSALRSIPPAPERVEDAATTVRGLYERHGQRVLTFCMSQLRNLEEAQDATQTTFLYVLRAVDRGDRPRCEVAWLLAIAHNVCRSTQRTLYRRNARTKHAEIDELEAVAQALGDDNDDLIWLRGALEQLPENQRKAILLREWQGLSYADMATELGLSIPAVEALLFRARRTLAAQRTGSKRLRGAFDLTALALGLRSLRNGALAKAAAVGTGVTLAASPFVVAEVAAKHAARASQRQAAGLSARPAEKPSHRRPVRPAATGRVAGAGSGAKAVEDAPAVSPPVQQQPPQSEPPAGGQLPPAPQPPALPPLPPLPPVVTDVLGQVPALPSLIQGTAGTLPSVGN